MDHMNNMNASDALVKLKEGNKRYLSNKTCNGDISIDRRRDTSLNGQHPYALIITCSDSRVIPEAIFDAGIAELFVIRDAGNVIGEYELGSAEYAISHLGVNLVLVLGHTECGAVGAALSDSAHGYIKSITDEIKLAVGATKDPIKATMKNAMHSAEVIKRKLDIKENNVLVTSAVYDIKTGEVKFNKE